MKIAGIFLNNEMRTGGHIRYLELMEGLALRGNDVVVLMNSFLGYTPHTLRALAYPVRYRRKSFPPASWVFRSTAARHAAEMRRLLVTPDAVLVHGETHLSAGAQLARALQVPLVYGHRSNTVQEILTYLSEPGRSPWEHVSLQLSLFWGMRGERKIARLADLIVFQSPYDQEDFLTRIPQAAGRVTVIRGNILGPRFLPEYARANHSEALRKIVFMGTLGPRKGIDYLIEAIIILAARGRGDISFEIYGPGERQTELEQRLRRAGNLNNVTFHGRTSSPFPALVAGDLLVVPSLFDSYPDTVLEALHVGIPVIGSTVGGIPDILRHDELLFPPMNAEAIADRIEGCVREPRTYEHLRQLCAGRRASFHFDWSEAWEREIGAGLTEVGGEDASPQKKTDVKARRS